MNCYAAACNAWKPRNGGFSLCVPQMTRGPIKPAAEKMIVAWATAAKTRSP